MREGCFFFCAALAMLATAIAAGIGAARMLLDLIQELAK
jgi:hypothetical protein